MVNLEQDYGISEDDIVISGFSGRFPMSDNLDELSDNLFSMTDLVEEMNEPSWKNSKFYFYKM